MTFTKLVLVGLALGSSGAAHADMRDAGQKATPAASAKAEIFCHAGSPPPCPPTAATPVDARNDVKPPKVKNPLDEINRPVPVPVNGRSGPVLAEIESTSCGYDLTKKPVQTVWRCELNARQIGDCRKGSGELGTIDMQLYCRFPMGPRGKEQAARRLPDSLKPTPTYPDPPALNRWKPWGPSGPGGSEPTRPTTRN